MACKYISPCEVGVYKTSVNLAVPILETFPGEETPCIVQPPQRHALSFPAVSSSFRRRTLSVLCLTWMKTRFKTNWLSYMAGKKDLCHHPFQPGVLRRRYIWLFTERGIVGAFAICLKDIQWRVNAQSTIGSVLIWCTQQIRRRCSHFKVQPPSIWLTAPQSQYVPLVTASLTKLYNTIST